MLGIFILCVSQVPGVPYLHVNSKTPEFTADIFLLNFVVKFIHKLDLVFACTFYCIGMCKFVLEGKIGWIHFTDASTIVFQFQYLPCLEIYSL